jgi:hypothetical protein
VSRDDSSARALLAALHEAALRADHLCEEGGADNGGQLQQAIENGEALWQQIHAGSRWASLPGASRAQALADAAAVLSVRATVTDDTSDILSALQLGESALALASDHAPELVAGLHAELAAIARQLPTGRYGDRVLEHSRLAAEQTPDGDPRRPLRLSNLGAVWRGRYVQSGDAEDLDRAITCFLTAREESGSPSGMIEHNLAVGLSDRYDRTGDPADLAAALDAAGRAVGATPRGSPDRPDYLAILAVCLWERYDATGSLSDLDRAIAIGTEAVDGLEPGAPARARLHSNLGMLHLDRYERSDDPRDLDRAIELARSAVDAASPADPERPGFCNNLANALRLRFERQFGRRGEPLPDEDVDRADLQSAIGLYRRAVSQPGPTEGDPATFLSNLGDALLDRGAVHELQGDLEAADATFAEALAAHEEAVAATPRAAPDRPGRLNKLAVARRARADRTSAQTDIDAARASFREACEAGLLLAPEMALSAAVNWVDWEIEKRAWPQVALGDGYAIRAAEALHRSQALRRHRESWLTASRDLAAAAAYAAAATSDLRGAVARIERARAVLLADSLDVVPVALARLPDPGLARRYAAAAEQVRRLLAA